MRSSNWVPSFASSRDRNACLVIDNLGKLGLIYCESEVENANVQNVIEDLLDGQYASPSRSSVLMSRKVGRGISLRR